MSNHQILSDSATIVDDPAQGPCSHPHVACERRGRMSIIYDIMGGGGGQDETMPLSPDSPTSSLRPLCRHHLNRLDDHRRHTRSRAGPTLAG